MAIKIKRSTGNLAPAELAAGQLAYVEGSENGGTLYYGEIGGTVREIGGRKYVDKLNGIEAGAQVNTVTSVAGKTGAVTLAAGDISGLTAAIEAASINALSEDENPTLSADLNANGRSITGVVSVTRAGSLSINATGPSGILTLGQNSTSVNIGNGGSTNNIGANNSGTTVIGGTGGAVVRINGSNFPQSLGSNGQVLTTNGSGTLSWTTIDTSIDSTDVTTALGFTPENSANKNQASGYAGLDANGLVPSSLLPSYVDDVLEYANLAAFPATGESGKIYVAADTSRSYRWTGSVYAEIIASPGTTDNVLEGTTNLYFTNTRARDAISVSGDLSYDPATGVISYTEPDLSGYALTSSLAAVATSGDYFDLTNLPNNLSDFNNDVGFITAGDIPTIPTDTSELTNGAGYLINVVDDSTPQLGGDLDVVGFKLTSSLNGWIESDKFFKSNDGLGAYADLMPNGLSIEAPGYSASVILDAGTGKLAINGLFWPVADGTNGQVLVTDGAGNLSFVTSSSGVTTFTALTDTPSAFTGAAGYYVKVNSGATALEFSQDVDDGTF